MLLLAPMTAVVATLAARDLHGLHGLHAHPCMVWLGNISFAFYLIQFPVMVLITRTLIGGRQFGIIGWAGFALLSLIVSTAIAAVLYHWVDLPIMRRFARPRRPPQP
ncbi:acyltransferase family protein [Nocardia sp. NBC_01730]|nr:acyltransferase family protein [Nocardia sp. NBC_01730]